MEYIQGFVHDSLTKTHYYQFNMNFKVVVCHNIRYSNIDLRDYSHFIDFEKEFIMCVKFFSVEHYATQGSYAAYTYLEGYYDLENVYTKVDQETIINRDFILTNSEKIGGKLLVDVTKKMNRNKKINLILE